MYKPRGILVAGNWKMNLGSKETEVFFSHLQSECSTYLKAESMALIKSRSLRACLIPPFLSLEKARTKLALIPIPITLAAQSAHWEKKGAFTGEISGPMLQEIGVHWALIGHSERRQHFGETDLTARKRADSLLEQGFHVIFCIGETHEERKAGKTQEVLSRQLTEGLPGNRLTDFSRGQLIVAYEPIWAIGTGVTAQPAEAEEAHQFIRKHLEHQVGNEAAEKIQILYGGSVTPENVESLLICSQVDGVLVGGASLKPESFLALLRSGAKVLSH